jgi:hypothetical protein
MITVATCEGRSHRRSTGPALLSKKLLNPELRTGKKDNMYPRIKSKETENKYLKEQSPSLRWEHFS